MKLFRRGESADESLVAVAAQHRWEPAPLGALSMMPPSPAAADVHSLDARIAARCGGRAFTAPIGVHNAPGVVSHVEIYRTESEEEIYDVIQWPLSTPWPARIEVLVGADLWNHHKLGDRFGHSTARKLSTSAGPAIRVSRLLEPALVEQLRVHPGLAAMQTAAAGVKGGYVAEVTGDRAAIFTWTVAAHGGRERWAALLAAADAFSSVLDAAA